MEIKKFTIAIIIVLIQIIISLYLGLSLPDDAKVPTHWNIRGEIDGYSGKWTAILLFPGINIAMLLLGIFFPVISPRFRNDPERFGKIMPSFINILVFFFAVIHIYTLLLGAELVSPTGCFIYYALGLMFILLGNLLPKLPSSFFIGIRTPWTLSSEHVWRKTHKVGGICLVLSGLLMIIIPAVWGNNATALTVMFILFMALVLYSVVYSYLVFKKEAKK